MYPTKDNSGRTALAFRFTKVYIIVCAFAFFGVLQQSWAIEKYNEGELGIEGLEFSDLIKVITATTFLFTYVAYIITFIRWFRRAYYNLHQINPVYPIHSEGWAAGAWFTPFINLVRPCRIMKEIFDGTLSRYNTVPLKVPGTIIGWWWGLFLLSNTFGRMSQYIGDENTLDGILLNNNILMLLHLSSVAGLVMLAILIKRYRKMDLLIKDAQDLPEDSIFHIPVEKTYPAAEVGPGNP